MLSPVGKPWIWHSVSVQSATKTQSRYRYRYRYRDQGDHPWDEILADRPGCLVWIDYRMLVSWVMENDAVITADRSVSDFLVAGQPLMQVW